MMSVRAILRVMRREFLLITSVTCISIFIGVSLYFLAPTQFVHTATNSIPENVDTVAVQTPHTEIDFNILDAGTHAADIAVRKNYAAYAKEDFAKIWKMAHGTNGPNLPEVDFSKEYVVGVFAGQKSTGGNAIAIASIKDMGDVRTVAINLIKPGTDCMVTQSLTNPYQIATIPFSDASLTHADTEVVTSCE